MKIAILLATYNSGRYLSQMLSSLVNQTVHDYYGACEQRFYSFCEALAAAATEEDRQTCVDEWNVFIKKKALSTLNRFSDVICTTSKELKAAEISKKYLLSKISLVERG